MDMKQDEREGIDDFVMRVRKKHQRINWDAMKDKCSLNYLMIGVTITRGTTSVNIREYCLSRSGVPNLDDVLAKGRSRESMKQHDREMIGNTDTAGREITFKSEPAFTVKSRYRKYSTKFDLEKNQKAMFDTNRKCKFCGFDWPHPKGPICIGISQTKKGLSPKLQEVLEEYQDRLNGIGTLKDKRGKIKYVKIQVGPAVRPVAQPYHLPPIHLEDKLIKVLDKWEDSNATETGPIIEKIPEDQPIDGVAVQFGRDTEEA